MDFTIWNAGGKYCDTTSHPYFWLNGKLSDQSKNWIRLYPDVIRILEELKKHNKFIVTASRTFEPMWAQELLQLLDIDKYFDLKEIYPSSKIHHFSKIQNHFKLPFEQMVFFDDEYRNIEEVGQFGVNTIFVKEGITFEAIKPFL